MREGWGAGEGGVVFAQTKVNIPLNVKRSRNMNRTATPNVRIPSGLSCVDARGASIACPCRGQDDGSNNRSLVLFFKLSP